jgi:hypothetical protein
MVEVVAEGVSTGTEDSMGEVLEMPMGGVVLGGCVSVTGQTVV